MHALIIEDEWLVAILIEYVLKDCGFDSFSFASSEKAAIAAAATQRPDLVTVDVRLEPGCGIEAVRSLRKDQSIPVIFITASGASTKEQISEHPVINKPFSQETLTYAVAASLRKSVAIS